MQKKDSSNKEIIQGNASIYGAFIALDSTQKLAEATKRVFHDSSEMERVLEQYKNCTLSSRQGRALEFLEALKFNRDAAENNRSDLFAFPTHFHNPKSPTDIIVTKNGEDVLGVQSKSRSKIEEAIRDHSDEKYHGLGRLNPVEQYDHINELLNNRINSSLDDQVCKKDYEDVHRHLMKSLKYEGVGSEGTDRAEAEFAALHPEILHLMQNGEVILKEVSEGALYGIESAAAFAAITKGILNTSKVIMGEKELATAISETLSMTASAALRGGVVAATTKVIGIAARSEGLKSFSEGAAPITLANTMYSMVRAINSYMKNDIDKETLKEECGEAAIRGVATYYCGIVGQIAIPIPIVGALVGSLVGYTTSAVLVQSGILGVGKKNIVYIAKKRREYVEAQCLKSIELMGMYRSMFEYIGTMYANQYIEKILPS